MLILKASRIKPGLRDNADMIAERKIDVAALAKTETKRTASVYEGKISKGSRAKRGL